MRQQIIEHPITTYEVAVNPFGDEPEVAGFYIGINDPVNGRYIAPTRPFETFEAAFRAILNEEF